LATILVVLLASVWTQSVSAEETDLQKQKRTMSDLQAIGRAIERYIADHDRYPSASTWSELSDQLSPIYIREIPALDAWGVGFSFVFNADGYFVGSCAKGATRCTALMLIGDGGETTHPADDVIFSNEKFLQWPAGPTGMKASEPL
jgi:type II secretory pathway pseudopilin PulG